MENLESKPVEVSSKPAEVSSSSSSSSPVNEPLWKRAVRNTGVRWGAGAILALAAYFGTKNTDISKVTGPPEVRSQAEVAGKPLGEKVAFEGVIKSGRKFQKVTMLNSEEDFRSPDNIAIKCAPGVEPSMYIGKKVKVTGRVIEYQRTDPTDPNKKIPVKEIAVEKIEIVS